MLVIPAIDLSEGKVVRLVQGDMSQKTVYSDDPVAVAKAFEDAGARVIHVVDLDGAQAGQPQHLGVLEKIADAVDRAALQYGGGLRSASAVEAAINAGARWAIVGTIAIEQPELLTELVQRFVHRLIVAIDSRNGKVAVRGWAADTGVSAADAARAMQQRGVQRLLCTDIASDGTLSGPNIVALREIARAVAIPVIASGGIGSIEDLLALRALESEGIIGAVVGRAIYEGRLDLRAAIKACQATVT